MGSINQLYMGINNIELPDYAIAALFKSTLVQVPSGEPAKLAPMGKPSVKITSMPHLGKNAKNILVLVNYPNEIYLPKKQLELLSSILKACGLAIDDTALVNTGAGKFEPTHLFELMKPATILIFGNHPSLANIFNFQEYERADADGRKVLTAPTLEVFDTGSTDSKANKGKLWTCLKSLFTL